MKNIINIILVVALILTACQKTEYDFPTGTLIGTIFPAGVKVTFDQGDKQFSAISDAKGSYVISNLEMGSYNIIFEKEGYFTFKKYGYQFLGGPTTEDISHFWIYELDLLPQATIEIDTIIYCDPILVVEGRYHRNTDVSFIWSRPEIRWFINDKPDVSPGNYLATFQNNNYGSFEIDPDNDLESTFSISSTSFIMDFSRLINKTTIYFIAYAGSGSASMYYFDWEKKETVYGIGTVGSNIKKVDIPIDFFLK